MYPVLPKKSGKKKKKMPMLYPVFAIGYDVMVIGGQREGLRGIVIHVTLCGVIIVDNAGFRNWLDCSDVIHTFGQYW
jgi:hypothetical protein